MRTIRSLDLELLFTKWKYPMLGCGLRNQVTESHHFHQEIRFNQDIKDFIVIQLTNVLDDGSYNRGCFLLSIIQACSLPQLCLCNSENPLTWHPPTLTWTWQFINQWEIFFSLTFSFFKINKLIYFTSSHSFLPSFPLLPVPSPTVFLFPALNPLLFHFCSGKVRPPMSINKTWHIKLW